MWLAPVLALLIGAAVVVWRVRGKAPAGAESGGAATTATAIAMADDELDPYLERVRREVEG